MKDIKLDKETAEQVKKLAIQLKEIGDTIDDLDAQGLDVHTRLWDLISSDTNVDTKRHKYRYNADTHTLSQMDENEILLFRPEQSTRRDH